MRIVPVPPHSHTQWIVQHRDGCCSRDDAEACDCWPAVQCITCEAFIDVGEWEWSRVTDGAVVHFTGDRVQRVIDGR